MKADGFLSKRRMLWACKVVRLMFLDIGVVLAVILVGITLGRAEFVYFAPFAVTTAILHLFVRAWHQLGDNEHKAMSALTTYLNTTLLEKKTSALSEIRNIFRHADSMYHQRVAFWFLSECALLAAAFTITSENQSKHNYQLLLWLSLFGLLSNWIGALSFWQIGARVGFALRALKTHDIPFQHFIESRQDRNVFNGGEYINLWLTIIITEVWTYLLYRAIYLHG